MSIRVNAISGVKMSYSVRREDGSSPDILNWKFRWFIEGQSSLEEYGVISEPKNKEFVYVTWKPIAEGTENIDRVLACEVTINNSLGEEICKQIKRIIVDVTDEDNDLDVDGDGFGGSDVSESDGYRLTDQCQILGKELNFVSTGNTFTTNFWWEISAPNGGTQNGGGYFIDEADANLGSIINRVADVDKRSYATAVFTNVPPSPPNNGFYYVKIQASDDNGKLSTPKYINFKLAHNNPTVITNSWVSTINASSLPVNFSWVLKNIKTYPSWFKVRAKLEIGQINCNPINANCYGANDADYAGAEWQTNSYVEIFENLVSEINTNNDYSFSYNLQLPDYFNPSWTFGDPDRFRIKLILEIWDPDLNPLEDDSCMIRKILAPQDVILEECPDTLEAAPIEFTGPECPAEVAADTITFTRTTSEPFCFDTVFAEEPICVDPCLDTVFMEEPVCVDPCLDTVFAEESICVDDGIVTP